MKIEEKVLKSFEKLAKRKVNPDDLISDLKIDSLDLAMLIFEAEQEFNTRISDEELSKVKTIKDVISLLNK
ncbi:phosphopantetheine-binding protein [Mycoplasma buteonis]|uniref:phosphopantetheine-binding protein n=1 Tax=Mycoplasma buteonis TaxID=171280 RepID=UPI000561C501|nr:phosphopantetheine-binding protein [Mycoplasma buteonis]